jgi:hypothetical protein
VRMEAPTGKAIAPIINCLRDIGIYPPATYCTLG